MESHALVECDRVTILTGTGRKCSGRRPVVRRTTAPAERASATEAWCRSGCTAGQRLESLAVENFSDDWYPPYKDVREVLIKTYQSFNKVWSGGSTKGLA